MSIYREKAVRPGRELPMSEAERGARVELAACYRVFDMLAWTELIFNHITLRVPGPEVRFLINPFGLHYREITASNLVLIDIDGQPLRGGRPEGRPVARQFLRRDAPWPGRLPRFRGHHGRPRREGAPGARHRRQAGGDPAQPRPAHLGAERAGGLPGAMDPAARLRLADRHEFRRRAQSHPARGAPADGARIEHRREAHLRRRFRGDGPAGGGERPVVPRLTFT